MAARRLLIVMLILLGLSTLAAALVPQHALRRNATTGTTTTQPTQSTTTTPAVPPGRALSATIKVGEKQIPVVAGPVCVDKRCGEPIHVGDQLSLQVFSSRQTILEIPAFGFVGVASHNSPALFNLLFREPTTVGIVDTKTGQPAARIEVLTRAAAVKELKASKGQAKKGKASPGSGSRSPARAG